MYKKINSTGMHRKKGRKDPKLWGHWVTSTPIKYTKYLQKYNKTHCFSKYI